MPGTPPIPLLPERWRRDWPRTLDLWDDVGSSAPPWKALGVGDEWLLRRRVQANRAFVAVRGAVPTEVLAAFLPSSLTLLYLHTPAEFRAEMPGWQCRERTEVRRLAAVTIQAAVRPGIRPLTEDDQAARDRLARRVPEAEQGHATLTLGAFSPTGSLLGLAAAREVTDGAEHGAWIGPVAVAREARRRGIGGALLAALATTLGPAGSKLALDAEASNRGALAFYSRLGFAPYGSFCLSRWQRS